MEKAFVIYRLNGFSRNLRQEATNKSRYYFFYHGIRNAIIAQFNGPDQRNDLGALWENFIMIERLKACTYASLHANIYFWHTYQQQEIDLIEEHSGKLFGYEFKGSKNKMVKAPSRWVETYENSEFKVVHPDNYLEYVLPQSTD